MVASVLRWIARFVWGRLVLRNPWFARVVTVVTVVRWLLRRRSHAAGVTLKRGETMVVSVERRDSAGVSGAR